MKIEDDLKAAAKAAAANGKDDVALLYMEAISVIAELRHRARDLLDAIAPVDISQAKDRLRKTLNRLEY